MLIIAAGQHPAEIDAAHAFHASVEVWIAADTGHTEASRTHPAEWERRVVTFLDRNLLPRSSEHGALHHLTGDFGVGETKS
jgi:hypothetical protein